MLRLLARMLAQEWPQAELLAAGTGAEAVDLALRLPDIVLLDLLMPGMSGLEVLNILRSNPATASVPVVVITARAPAEEWAALKKGEIRVLRNRGFAAGELMRVLDSLQRALPPHYAIAAADA